MRLLVVAPQPFFSPRGTPFSVYYRTQVTCELGHEVDLLTYGQGDDVDIPGCRIIRIPPFRWLGPVRIGPSSLKLWLDVFMMAWTIGCLLRRRYDVVHAHEEAVFWCRWLKPFFRFRLIYDMHSSLPQQLDNFQFTKSRLVHSAFKVLEKSAVKAADAVIVICPALNDYARTLTGRESKVVLIENSLFDPVSYSQGTISRSSVDETEQVERARNLQRWISARPSEQMIVYAGTLEVYQGIDRLLAAFSLVSSRLPKASLLVVGGLSSDVAERRTAADALGLADAVHFAGQVSQEEAQRLVGLGAASVSPRFAGNNTPMKIYQLMAAGIPLIATRIESHTQVLNDRIALLAEVSTEALAEAIIQVLSNPEDARAMAERARSWYERNYSREVYTSKMRELLARVA